MDERLKSFKRLLDIMDELREKCPWDKKQTMESLRYLTLEEVYELSDAIIVNNQSQFNANILPIFNSDNIIRNQFLTLLTLKLV